MPTLILLVLAFIVAPGLPAQQLTEVERTLVSAVDRNTPQTLQLLARAVNLNSGTFNLQGVRRVGRLFQAEYDRLGFRTRWIDGRAWGRAGHLIAEWRGRGQGPKLLFIGHLDTVFERDSPFQKYARLSDSSARGPGVIDMKGGDVIMLLVLRSLKQAGLLSTMQVTVVLTGDEEDTGRPLSKARADLLGAARWADVAIGFEDGAGDPRTAVTGRRGWTGWTLRTQGKPGHSSLIFSKEVGSGAIFEAARILAAFRDSLAGEEYLTFNPGFIAGGTTVGVGKSEDRASVFGKSNVISDETVVMGDLRTLTPEQRDATKQRMQALAGRSYAGTSATLEFEDTYPPLAPTDGNRKLLELLDQASRDLGAGPVTAVNPASAGAADVSFTAGLVDMALDGVGLMGSGGHSVHETADLRTLPMQAKRIAIMLARLNK
jgi:glutamate carboxypeptidase